MTDAVVVVHGADGATNYIDNLEVANAAAPNGLAKRQQVAAYTADGGEVASETTLGRRFGGSKLPFSGLLTSTTDVTPTSGKAIRLLWASVIPNPDNSTANLVQIGFVGDTPAYTTYALAHWERFDGDTDQVLRITLANSQPVAVTVHYEEF